MSTQLPLQGGGGCTQGGGGVEEGGEEGAVLLTGFFLGTLREGHCGTECMLKGEGGSVPGGGGCRGDVHWVSPCVCEGGGDGQC